QVGQLCLIFRPVQLDKTKSNAHPKHLAYVEWFHLNPIDQDTNMFSVKKLYDDKGNRKGGIIEVEDIVQPCPLSPKFGQKAANLDPIGIQITGENCIENVETFWINSFHTKSTYQTVF
ncbi:hypothetical protein BU17DRAFT_50234, partial [Hysterangium stoloniferum]